MCWVQMLSVLPLCRSRLLDEHLRAISVPSSAALLCHQGQLWVRCLLLFPLLLFGLFSPSRQAERALALPSPLSLSPPSFPLLPPFSTARTVGS